MALTDEEQRALAYNLSRRNRHMACAVRAYVTQGSPAAKKALTDRMIAVTREQNSEERAKVQYDERFDNFDCEGVVVNG